ncbi:stage II sporulation protein D [Robertmurraya yapensis]|uniref:Stage II sporulation protein D n=1 Tax=Bacillus yapensis TaxID=2492960 RepID=A0A3S0II17_9BACI|nr:stage II sporulation protein D [Bacillus yapensis]RTR32973.1 stage II sporulation protein D [Bacillus yapensis]TKS96796.1 stage II sporulation protein D [Bacillus yapensis]
MIKMKPFALLAAVLFVVTIMIPTLLVLPFMEKSSGNEVEATPKVEVDATQPAVEVAVYRSGQEKVEKLPLEEYLVGVVAAEMPADFELEALKAQALSARTYTVDWLMSGSKAEVPEGIDADISDTENNQVYKNDEELRKQWGKEYSWRIKKIKEAVAATSGQILTFEGDPIYAAFFSTSNGYTENSEDYFQETLPYLKSVESPWDVNTEKFHGQTIIQVTDFEKKLGVKIGESAEVGKILERTKGNRVAKVDINGKQLTGKEVREGLGLKSSDFTWERKGDKIVINTKGNGHGVGMSQYGANGMAQEGKKYDEIVQYYYNGATIDTTKTLLTKITASR